MIKAQNYSFVLFSKKLFGIKYCRVGIAIEYNRKRFLNNVHLLVDSQQYDEVAAKLVPIFKIIYRSHKSCTKPMN